MQWRFSPKIKLRRTMLSWMIILLQFEQRHRSMEIKSTNRNTVRGFTCADPGKHLQCGKTAMSLLCFYYYMSVIKVVLVTNFFLLFPILIHLIHDRISYKQEFLKIESLYRGFFFCYCWQSKPCHKHELVFFSYDLPIRRCLKIIYIIIFNAYLSTPTTLLPIYI